VTWTAIIISSALRVLSASSSSSLRSDLKQIRNCFFWLFIACTFMVVVGAILEEIEFRTAKPYMDTESGAFVPERRRKLATLGLWILVVGITGEGLFEMATSWTDGISEDFSNSLLLNAEALTGNAAKSAKTAQDEADDLLKKYEASERELLALKAKSLPRRLSSQQKELLGKRVAAFATKSISISCVIGGGAAAEPADFANDFILAFKNPNLGFDVQIPFGTCSMIMAPDFNAPSVQVEAGVDRQNDADILVKALIEIGIDSKNIGRKNNKNKALLALTIGPKPTT
jgi:hypothetical protein